MTKIETERLILRRIDIAEAEAIYRNWANNPAVYNFMPPYYNDDAATAHRWIDECMQGFAEAKPDTYKLFAIDLTATGETIGIIELTDINYKVRAAEAGYHLAKKWWGNGYAAEALRVLLAHCFEDIGLNRVYACYDPRNPNSGRVMQKAGMLYEGTFRQCEIRWGKLVDRVHYAMLKEDFDRLD